MQIGYLTAERAPWIGSRMSREVVTAIFQQQESYGAVIRVGIGCEPVLPDPSDSRALPWPPPRAPIDDGFWPDEIYADD